MHTRIRWAAVCLSAALAGAVGLAPAAWAGDLAQVVSADEEVAAPGTPAVISRGHVDVGVSVVDGSPEFLARDDSGPTPVWRQLDDVVFQVGDAALLNLPEDEAYSFVGAAAGDGVWVVPQTELADVPWVGWNTQAPSLADAVDRGVTMELLGHSGPGDFSLFLQNGGFEPPQLLWSTASGQSDGFWVDLNTHTHANWTFTEPGIHQVGIRVTGQRTDGSELAVDGVLTFAVGDGADVQAAQDTQWSAPASAAPATGGIPAWIFAVLGAGALLLIGAVIAVVRAGRRPAHD